MRFWEEIYSSFAFFKSNIGCIGRRMSPRSVLPDAAAWTFFQQTMQLCIMEDDPKNHLILSQSLTTFKTFLQESNYVTLFEVLWRDTSEAGEIHCKNKLRWTLAIARKQSGFGEMHLYGIDSTSRNYVIYYGHSDIHPRPGVILGGKEKEELPKGQCLRRPVSVREP